MYPNVVSKRVRCPKCGCTSFYDADFIKYDVYYCLHKFRDYHYCGGIKAKCDICKKIEALSAFYMDDDGRVFHKKCGTSQLGLSLLKQSNDIIIDNAVHGRRPTNIPDFRDFLCQRHIFIPGINGSDKED